ncbi:hypothetical protein VXE43_21120, partial [Acinetobacter baumannii]|uniref:hypothetical protein n=1 Tax=Acinetobacter baumannii TaxID=470 RepID=UPI0030FAA9AF
KLTSSGLGGITGVIFVFSLLSLLHPVKNILETNKLHVKPEYLVSLLLKDMTTPPDYNLNKHHVGLLFKIHDIHYFF